MKVGNIMKKIINTNLKTPEYELLNRECPLSEYPRPSFKRDSYISLNGEWDYLVTEKFELSLDFEGKILVPYCIESSNSGVQRALKKGVSGSLILPRLESHLFLLVLSTDSTYRKVCFELH